MSRDGEPRPELLAPAGDWECLRAAVANGADAVYFGLGDFNARLRATNFTVGELPDVLRFLHNHNVRGYVTLNTLVFPDELPAAAERLKAIAEAGTDAVIVQDLGLVPLIRRLAPSLPIHASTQMTLTEPRGIELVRRLGIRRVILARELSLDQIRRIAEATTAELEVFVHGALCISFSGQCLASLSMGGRSANRGLCAQACRLPYQLVAEGRALDLGTRRHLLSPQDLAAWDRLADLVRLGVRGFKIEGRLKGADYVAGAVRTCRAALDAALAGRPFALSPDGEAELAQGFSRGFSHGFLDGTDHQALVVGRSPKSRGLEVGCVAGTTQRGVVAALTQPLKPGDGVVFDAGGGEEEEQGGRIVAVEPVAGHADRVLLVFRRDDVRLGDVPAGSVVWKTDDPEVHKRLEQSYARDRVARPVPLAVRVRAALGEPLAITVCDDAGHTAAVSWERPLERAEKYPLSLDVLREQLGRLGGTPFELGVVETERLDPVMVPKSVLNDLRRQAVDALLEQREASARHAIAEPAALDRIRHEALLQRHEGGPAETRVGVTLNGFVEGAPGPKHGEDTLKRTLEGGTHEASGLLGHKIAAAGATQAAAARLTVLVRNLEQLEAVLAWLPTPPVTRPAMVYCDLREPGLAKGAVARGRQAGLPVGLPTLRIVAPGDEGHLQELLDARPDALLVRNLASIAFAREHAPGLPLVGDFSLNVANDLAAGLLAREFGLARLVPSLDLDWERLRTLLGRVRPDLVEIVIHQHVPMFHTQHCLFAANLSRGRDRRDCGRPCHRRVELRDRLGARHPVVADAACRITVFHARAQSAAEYLGEMQRLGVSRFRIEFLDETPDQTRAVLDCYGRLLAGLAEPRAVLRELRGLLPCGVTRGTFDRGRRV